MKISIIVSVLIVVAGVCLVWDGHGRLAAVRATHEALVAEAATLGIGNSPASNSKHETAAREDAGKLTTAEFIAFALEVEAYEKSGAGKPDEAMQKRIADFINRLMELNPAQLKALIAGVIANQDLKESTRRNFIGFSIMTLANDHPQSALGLFKETSDLFSDVKSGGQIIASSLARWAKDDPMAALGWYRENADTYASLITDGTKLGMIVGASLQYPKLAFKLISELDFKDPGLAIQNIINTTKSAGERTTTLAAMRMYLATLKDDATREDLTKKAVNALAIASMQDGYESASQWLAAANLTPGELETFADSLKPLTKNAENGKWIEWLGNNLPLAQADGKIRRFISVWAQYDCMAAGKWLTGMADGPAKNPAISAFAATVACYEPDTAIQWAMTIPAGKERDETLVSIYKNWPKGDPAAAKAAEEFAKQNGIK